MIRISFGNRITITTEHCTFSYATAEEAAQALITLQGANK